MSGSTPHLTEIFADNVSHKFAVTPRGMAHTVASGPEGETCRTCTKFISKGYASATKSILTGQKLRAGPCRKYAILMNLGKRQGPKIPPNTPACRHHEKNPNPPAAVQR